MQFTSDDKLATAKNYAQTRFFAVAAWNKDVDSKPIYAVSDTTGNVATQIAKAAFLQLGKSSKCQVSVFPQVRSKEAIEKVVKQASEKGGMIVATLASPELSALLIEESETHNVTCVQALEPVLQAMEKRFKVKRGTPLAGVKAGGKKPSSRSDDADDSLFGDAAHTDLTVFAASDNTGKLASCIAKAALKQFLPDCGVKSITVCPKVRSLEEVDCIATEAFGTDSLVLFSFASPGMSRFMRQQCERVKVVYADVLQPMVVAMEKFFDYPPVGVAGGMDTAELDRSKLGWQKQPV